MFKFDFNEEFSMFDIWVERDDGKKFGFNSLTLLDVSNNHNVLELLGANIKELNPDTTFVLYEDNGRIAYYAYNVYAQYSVKTFEEALELAKKDIQSREMQKIFVKNQMEERTKKLTKLVDEFNRARNQFQEEMLIDESDFSNQCVDGQKWAQEFCRIYPFMDEGTMLCWFANAIEAGKDSHYRKREE